ncbi:MAG TPA: NAD(P)-binding domain-containing protein [Hyphomicrobiaceae bacterium]|jgi:3-hydroxyisobutyrate dehydrogenase|nr:NAD(P)-binding domain-containing protein [Hyphomicrobiaceae bacterium]
MAETIGFIGLGAMGGGMAANLLKAGFALVVNDIDAAKVQALVARGAKSAATPAEVARQSARTVTIVETTAQTEEVILGEQGVIRGAARGHVVAMMSTIDPHAARAIHDRLKVDGIAMLDAPVSGGSTRAATGELSVIAGGDAATFEACLPMFKAMSSNQFHVGGIGQGLALKLVNNMLIQVNTVAIAEAFVMGAKAGLDPKVMYDVIKVSTGASFALDHRVPRIIAGDFAPGGTVDISYKDQELETAFAKSLGVPLLLANVTQQVYQMARAAGFSKEDGASVVKVYERMAGVRLGPR